MTACAGATPRPTHPRSFDIRLNCNEMAVRAALRHVRDRLEAFDIEAGLRGTVELVLAEVLNNIVEHAYACGSGHDKISIRCLAREDGVHLSLEDRGRAMPGGQLPTGAAPPTQGDIMDLPEGGFGWFLIRGLATDVRYARIGGRNRLDLRIPVSR